MSSFRSFTVSGVAFESSTHFEPIFLCGVKERSDFILSHVHVWFSQHLLLFGFRDLSWQNNKTSVLCRFSKASLKMLLICEILRNFIFYYYNNRSLPGRKAALGQVFGRHSGRGETGSRKKGQSPPHCLSMATAAPPAAPPRPRSKQGPGHLWPSPGVSVGSQSRPL